MKRFLATCALALLAAPAWAQHCTGEDLIARLAPEDQQWLSDRIADVPYHQGLLWQAQRGDQRLVIVGTYHFDHWLHEKTLARLAPELAQADRLMVELGPAEEAQMKAAITSDPSLMVNISGPTLPERLDAETWAELSRAMTARGIPAIMVSKMRPWYVAMMLGMSPCLIQQMTAQGAAKGLDWQLADLAQADDIPIEALEPWDTVMRMFDGLTPEEEIQMLTFSLPMANLADDYTVTMEKAYGEGDIWRIWEFTRLEAYRKTGLSAAEVDTMTAETEEILIFARNRNWIAPINAAAGEAAAKGKSVVVAFGALHLPAEEGVLRLLERDGWTITGMD